MNISGITSTDSMINYPAAGASGKVMDMSIDSIDPGQGAHELPLGIAVSARVMGMEQDAFEAAATQLINSMTAVMTGLGQNIDITV